MGTATSDAELPCQASVADARKFAHLKKPAAADQT